MLKYFLEEELREPSAELKAAVKTHCIRKRPYEPFHLDCPFSKRRLCYCAAHAYTRTPARSRTALWQNYQPVHDFYTAQDPALAETARKAFQHVRDKIRKLSRAETAEFVRNLRSEKTLHMGENGEYEAL